MLKQIFVGSHSLVAWQTGGADEAQERSFIGQEGGDTGAAFEFLVDALDGVAAAQRAANNLQGKLRSGVACRMGKLS